ncbi:MAG: YbaK/EbsC family protein [Verrucomicrobia bacterium]|nr:YbaK/EbsC family protein [Verrucomicrobiota bacterium]
MTNLKESAQQIQGILTQHGLSNKVVEFKELTRTAQEAADAIGCQVGQIAKSLIFKGKKSGKPVCIIASGTNRVDEKKVGQLIGEEIERADADFVRQHTGFAIGGIPPIGFHLEIAPLVDEDLLQYQELWAAAGTPHAVFCIAPADLLRITGGKVANIRKL